MLYKDWLYEWLENYVKPSVKIRSYLKYKRDINLYISQLIETKIPLRSKGLDGQSYKFVIILMKFYKSICGNFIN